MAGDTPMRRDATSGPSGAANAYAVARVVFEEYGA